MCAARIAPSTGYQRSGKSEDDKVKARLHFLRMVAQGAWSPTLGPEFTDRVRGRSFASAASGPAVTVSLEKQHAIAWYGFLATCSTNIGLREPRILRWVQDGSRGEELKQRLVGHPLMTSCFERFAMDLKQIASASGFRRGRRVYGSFRPAVTPSAQGVRAC